MNLPSDFKTYACEALSKDRAEVLFKALETGQDPIAIRVNKNNLEIEYEESVPWCANGRYLSKRPIFTLDPLFHAGAYYVQDPSTMYMDIVKEAIDEDYSSRDSNSFFWNKALKVLDLCAAPGGKSTHLLSIINSDSLLVSNEVIKSRSSILAENISKWACDNAVVTNNDPADFNLKDYFNLIVVDAPCSGEGMFRKDPKAIEHWSIAAVELCAARQKRILKDIWPNLEDGGYLVYSTCTFNIYENDNIVKYIKEELGADIIQLKPVHKGVFITPFGGLQFIPGFIKGEGQYLAILRKKSKDKDEVIVHSKNKFSSYHKPSSKAPQALKNMPFLPSDYRAELIGELVKVYPNHLLDKIKYIESKLRVVLSGRIVATLKGNDFVPYADLAFCPHIDSMGLNKVDVPKDLALQFLAKEAIILNDAPFGYILISYKGYGLGFVKNLGNRCNNLLPVGRRIRMDINSAK